MRRSRADMRLGRFLTIGMRFRCRQDREVWTVHQVHRAEAHVELVNGRHRQVLPFADLRADFVLIAIERSAA